MWQVNQTIKNDRFLIQKVLGGGGFGIAYRALDTKNNQQVVIKTLNQHQQNQAEFDALQEKFVNEAMTLKGLSHPQIVKVYELIQADGLWGMVMEYIDGQELAEYVEERGKLTELQALGYIEQVGKALIYTHQQKVIHRDIKPHNIMLRSGNREAVLIDFGLARGFIDGKTLSMTNSRTPAYAPIEQYDRHGKFGAYTDVYALAATLYHLLTGTPPLPSNYRQLNYPLSPPSSLNPQISQVVEAGIIKGMELQPQDRPQSMGEFFQLLGLGEKIFLPKSKLAPSAHQPVTPIKQPIQPQQRSHSRVSSPTLNERNIVRNSANRWNFLNWIIGGVVFFVMGSTFLNPVLTAGLVAGVAAKRLYSNLYKGFISTITLGIIGALIGSSLYMLISTGRFVIMLTARSIGAGSIIPHSIFALLGSVLAIFIWGLLIKSA